MKQLLSLSEEVRWKRIRPCSVNLRLRLFLLPSSYHPVHSMHFGFDIKGVITFQQRCGCLPFFSFRCLTQATNAMKFHSTCPAAGLHLQILTTRSPCKAVPSAFLFQGKAVESFCEKWFHFGSLSVITVTGVSVVFNLQVVPV